MKPASTTRSGSKAATVSVSVLSQWPRLVKSATLRTIVGTPPLSARTSPSIPSRSAPTATTRAPYAGSSHASRSACRLVPAPETSTTRRVAGTGTGYRGSGTALPPGSDHSGDQPTEAHRHHGGHEHLPDRGTDVGHPAGAHRASGEGDGQGDQQGPAEAA